MNESMKIQPNAYDVRIECNTCHASWSGSLARARAGAHVCPGPIRDDSKN